MKQAAPRTMSALALIIALTGCGTSALASVDGLLVESCFCCLRFVELLTSEKVNEGEAEARWPAARRR
jgi:hypothetical protein